MGYLAWKYSEVTIDNAVVLLWMALVRGQGPLFAYAGMPIIHGQVPLEITLIVHGCQTVMKEFPLHIVGAHPDLPLTRSGLWFVLAPDAQWESEHCIMHIRGAQSALFLYP